MKAMLPAAIATFVASIMVAATTLAVATTIHLSDTKHQVDRQGTMIRQQQQKIILLAAIASDEKTVIDSHSSLIAGVLRNEKGLLSLVKVKTLAR